MVCVTSVLSESLVYNVNALIFVLMRHLDLMRSFNHKVHGLSAQKSTAKQQSTWEMCLTVVKWSSLNLKYCCIENKVAGIRWLAWRRESFEYSLLKSRLKWIRNNIGSNTAVFNQQLIISLVNKAFSPFRSLGHELNSALEIVSLLLAFFSASLIIF